MLGSQLFGRILGSSNALNKITDGAVAALDKIAYTKEEKAEDAQAQRAQEQAIRNKAQEQIVEWMKATQGQNLARRLLALVVTAVWLLMYGTSCGIAVVTVFLHDSDTVERLNQASEIVGGRADQMGGAMMLILGFYFGAPYMSDITKAAITRFGNGPDKGSATSGSQTVG